MWIMKSFIIPVFTGVMEIVTKGLKKIWKQIDSLWKTVVLGTLHIIKKVLQS